MEDPPVPPKPVKEEGKVELEVAFKPGGIRKKGFHGTFEKPHEYMASPPREIKRAEPKEDAPPGFKPTHNTKSSPFNSVACNMRNLRVNYPSSFTSRSPR